MLGRRGRRLFDGTPEGPDGAPSHLVAVLLSLGAYEPDDPGDAPPLTVDDLLDLMLALERRDCP